MSAFTSIALSQMSLNKLAKIPGGPAQLRSQRENAIKVRANDIEQHRRRLAEIDGLIERIGMALGEVAA